MTGAPSRFLDIEFRDEVASTNDVARERAIAGAGEGVAIRARRQAAGRGTRGRGWTSPEGNLYLSVILRPACAPIVAGQLSFVVALAVGDAARACLPGQVDIRNKWPNDVLVNGRKISGILLEASGGGEVAWVVAGIGINVGHHPPVEATRWPATSIVAEGGADDIDAVVDALDRALGLWYRRWRAEGFGPIRAAWLARAHALGQDIDFVLGEERLMGRFETLDESGALWLALPGGGRRVVASGEIVLRRAA
ncbi:MAG: biotin--[acetyl-CoA-carboxylase] ligase [Alphaproteobacteria bacterium]|nr:biotin--[acetyl-CoA-carboxylase] ligase [Alphaproteobacteria bacterium]